MPEKYNSIDMKKLLLLGVFLMFGVDGFSQAPGKPTNLAGNQVNLENKIALTWVAPVAPNDTLNGYKIYYRVKGSTAFDSVKTANVLTHTLSGLSVLDTIYNVYLKTFRVKSGDTLYSAAGSTINVTVAKLVKPTVSVDFAFVTYNSFIVKVADINRYETSFKILVTQDGFSKEETIANGGSTLYKTIGGLKPNTQYTVKAAAVRNGIEGPYSDVAYFKTAVDLPVKAVVQKDSDCPFSSSFSWTLSEREDQIEETMIYRSKDNQNFTLLASLYPSVKTYTDSGSDPGITYYYRVTTRNVSGATHSDALKIDVKPYVAPNLPINIKTQPIINTITVSWEAGEQDWVCRTNLLQNTELAMSVNGGERIKLVDLPNWTQNYTITGLNPNDEVEIFFRTWSDKEIISNWTSVKAVTNGAPPMPTNFIGVLGKDRHDRQVLFLSWDNVEREDYYVIEKSSDGINYPSGNQAFVPFLLFDVTKLSDFALEEGNSYFYRIKAGNWTEYQSNYNTIGPFSIPYTKIPNAPYGLNAKVNGNGIDLTWVDDSRREKNYILEKSNNNGETFIVVATLDKNVTKYRDENVSEGKTYIYRVMASNTLGNSAYSKVRKVTIGTAASGSVNISVYPNPVVNVLNVKAENLEGNNEYSVKIFDGNNRLIKDSKILLNSDSEANISVSNLPQGVYNVLISDGETLTSKRIVKM